MNNKKILITGATGFVGRHLVNQLKDQGAFLHLALRTTGEQFSDPQITVFSPIDFSLNADWGKMLKGCEIIIHTAARAHILKEIARDPLDEFRKVNTAGTLNLAQQAAELGVKRFIFLSSIGVNGSSTDREQLFRALDLANPSNPYAISKHEAEQGLRLIAQETGMEIVIIRPPLIYGAGAKGNFDRLIQWLQKGIPLPLGAIDNKRSFVSIDNLVSLILVCIDHPLAANQIFLVSDGEDLSTPALLHKISAAINKPAHLFPVPQRLLTLLASVLGRKADLQRLCDSLRIDISETCKILNWKPEISMDETLRAIVKEL